MNITVDYYTAWTSKLYFSGLFIFLFGQLNFRGMGKGKQNMKKSHEFLKRIELGKGTHCLKINILLMAMIFWVGV